MIATIVTTSRSSLADVKMPGPCLLCGKEQRKVICYQCRPSRPDLVDKTVPEIIQILGPEHIKSILDPYHKRIHERAMLN